MELILCSAYVLLLAAQILLLIGALRKPEGNLWSALFKLEGLSLLGAAALAAVFNALPGRGMAPGLTWMAEFFYSFFAAIGYGVMILVSVVAAAVLDWRK